MQHTREVHGLLENGERVGLGFGKFTDEDVDTFCNHISEIYAGRKEPVFSVGTRVYNANKFAGVEVAEPFPAAISA